MEESWKTLLRREASAHRMCAEYRVALDAVETKSEAIALYKKCIDWALEEGYPALPLIRSLFRDCEKEGIFIDKEFHGEVLDSQQVYVFHNCTGVIRTGLNVKAQIIPMLYFANGCNMSVRSAGASHRATRVPLYVFGKNRILGEKSDDIVCTTYEFDVK